VLITSFDPAHTAVHRISAPESYSATRLGTFGDNFSERFAIDVIVSCSTQVRMRLCMYVNLHTLSPGIFLCHAEVDDVPTAVLIQSQGDVRQNCSFRIYSAHQLIIEYTLLPMRQSCAYQINALTSTYIN
jgi:hypothetical protein